MIRSVTRPRAGFGDEQKAELYEWFDQIVP